VGPDDEGFRAFVAARSPALLSFAYLLTGDRRDAEDVVQTALAQTALAWRRVRRKDNPEGYVRRVIVTTHLNAMRRQPWRERPTGLVPEHADRPGSAAEGAADERDAMWQLLATLPPRQRSVLVLRFYEDLPVAEVAEILGCSQGTVKSQSFKALAHLRAALAAEEAPS
jgi:RNA polymerase sigma-70 factor (sigma-E family)